jgi:hypothetical protein
MKKGEIYEKKLSTTWFFWACPEKGCKMVLKATVEKFVEKAAFQHRGKHQREHDEAVQRQVNLAKIAVPTA